MREVWDFAIIGGGASGMAAAIASSENGENVLLIEKNDSLGKKISASGNGRCNLMNRNPPVYYGDSSFAASVIQKIGPDQLRFFWNKLGLYLSEDHEGRIYPFTYQSVSVNNVLKLGLKANHVHIVLQTTAQKISREKDCFHIICDKDTFKAKRVLIAAGGPAAAKLGGTDSGYSLLASFGHTIIPPDSALCSLYTDEKSISGLSGIRVRCAVSLFDADNNLLHQEKGEVLFSDTGISGICVLQCARFVSVGCRVQINFVYSLFENTDDIISALVKQKEIISGFPIQALLYGILLPKLSYAVMKQAQIEMRNRTVEDLSFEEIKKIAYTLSHYSVQIKGKKGLEDSQVTAGGAKCDEFCSDSMESRLIPGLYASGEVLNIDGDCGGYNLMFAFASGIIAGSNGKQKGNPYYEKG